MKKRMFKLPVMLGIFLLFTTNNAHAQILKKLLDNVKSTTENRINQKVSEQTNKALDKLDSAAFRSVAQNQAADSESINKILEAYTQAAGQNPNDTSAGSITMKTLGILTRGNGVSAADSAAAIATFKNANGGDGYYYETSSSVITISGTVESMFKTYFTSSGEARVEMDLTAMMGMKGGTPLISISRVANPLYSILLDDTEKKWFLNIVDTAMLNEDNMNYTVTKIGNETINGYPCVHSKLTSKGKSDMDIDIWTSKSVPGYSSLEKWMANTKNITTPEMMKALKQAGADGYFVKMEMKNKDITSTMLLTKADHKNLPASLFVIPADYNETYNNIMLGNMMKAAQKQ